MDENLLRSIIGLGGVPVILGLIQVFKPFISDTRWYPIVAIVIGLVINVGAAFSIGITNRLDVAIAIIAAITAGLAASGLYSVATTFKEGESANKNNPNHKT